MEQVTKLLKLNDKDGYVIIAGEKSKINFAIDSVINRIKEAKKGIPTETRQATATGETVYLRPKPGASRMYPETDIPPIILSEEEIKNSKTNVPKSWDESLQELQQKYQLNTQLAEQIFDSEYLNLFEKICTNKKNSPNFVASTLYSTITNLQRKGLDSNLLKPQEIIKSFEFLTTGKISKESMEIIFELIMSGKTKSVEESIDKSSLKNIDGEELDHILEKVINDNMNILQAQGHHAVGALMGIAMKSVRGKASGEKINQLLKEKINKYLRNNKE
jgi:glutamyl-tRNA(Gln) amidotransferase subunit E